MLHSDDANWANAVGSAGKGVPLTIVPAPPVRMNIGWTFGSQPLPESTIQYELARSEVYLRVGEQHMWTCPT